MAKARGLVKYGDLLKWLKTECGLGHGHANAIILYIKDPEGAKRKLRESQRDEQSDDHNPRRTRFFSGFFQSSLRRAWSP